MLSHAEAQAAGSYKDCCLISSPIYSDKNLLFWGTAAADVADIKLKRKMDPRIIRFLNILIL